MPVSGQRLDGLCYMAWDVASKSGKIGDASNHRLRLVRDGLEILPQNSPSEVDGTGCPGLYKISLTDSEMSGSVITLAGISLTSGVLIVPVQITTSAALANAFSTTSTSSAHIWTDAQLAQWSIDALGQIGIDIKCIWAREALEIQRAISTYALPSYLRTLRRVTWRGISLTPLSWIEMEQMLPVENSIGVPQFYSMSQEAPFSIRFYPAPNESFSNSGFDVSAPRQNEANCVLEFWRTPEADGVNALPRYVQRRTLKAFVLWKAFAAEGRGQNLKASEFYKSKYEFLIEQFRRINDGCYIGKRYALGDGEFAAARTPGRPVLPSNFESVGR